VPPRPAAVRVPDPHALAAGALLALLALLGPAAATAHPVTSRTENNRYVKLTLAPGSLRVAYSVLYGELPSFYARRGMDRDGDGRVAPDEARAHADELAARFAAASVLTVDGQRIPLRLPDRAATLADPRVGPIPFAVDLWEVVPLPRRRHHEIAFEAGGELPRLGETEVKFEPAPTTRLVSWCRSRPPCTTRAEEPRFVWMGLRASSMEDRTVSASYDVPGAGVRPGTVTALVGAGALLLAAAAAGVLVVRRRKRT
jgi:hypothetical protein